MANLTYDLQWREAMQDVVDLLELEQPPEHELSEEELFAHFQYMYTRYLQVYHALEDCVDQHVHPQKRMDIVQALDVVAGRMLEMKSYLMKLHNSPFIAFDEILVDLKLTPDILDLKVPRCFVNDRQTELESRRTMIQAFIEAKKQKEAEEQGEEGEGAATTEEGSQSIGGLPEMSLEQAIRIIQVNERGRQGRQRAKIMAEIVKREIREREEEEGEKPYIDPDEAANAFQRIWRGFKGKVRAKKLRDEELVLIGMLEPPEPELTQAARAEEVRSGRRQTQQQNVRQYHDALVSLREQIYQEEGPDARNRMRETIMEWFVKYHEQNGALPEMPDEDDGGSAFLFEKPIVLPGADENAGGEDGAKPKPAAKKDDKGKGKGKGKGKDDEDDDEEKEAPPSVYVLGMQDAAKAYMEVWEAREAGSHFETKLDKGLIKDMLREGVIEDIRKQDVDTAMRQELENLRMRHEAGKKGKKGKGGKKGKKKKDKKKAGGKKKKRKDPTESRAMDAIFGELVQEGILRVTDPVNLPDFVGEARNLDTVMIAAGIPLDPSLVQVRQAIAELCSLPLGSSYLRQTLPDDSFPRTVMLYGPSGTGKTMLIKSIAHECGANFFDLTPKNTDGKYPKKQVALMLHMVFKVARALMPSVIYIGDAELGWLADKKKLREYGANLKENGNRIMKDLVKEVKGMDAEDQILIIGETKQPFLLEKGDLKKFQAFWKRFIYCPAPDYASIQVLFKHFIGKNKIHLAPNFDFATLSHTCHEAGFTAGSIKAAVENVITERRVLKVSKKGKIQMEEVLAGLVKQDPVYKQIDEDFRAWTAKVVGLPGKRAEVEEGGDKKKGKKGKKGKKK